MESTPVPNKPLRLVLKLNQLHSSPTTPTGSIGTSGDAPVSGTSSVVTPSLLVSPSGSNKSSSKKSSKHKKHKKKKKKHHHHHHKHHKHHGDDEERSEVEMAQPGNDGDDDGSLSIPEPMDFGSMLNAPPIGRRSQEEYEFDSSNSQTHSYLGTSAGSSGHQFEQSSNLYCAYEPSDLQSQNYLDSPPEPTNAEETFERSNALLKGYLSSPQQQPPPTEGHFESNSQVGFIGSDPEQQGPLPPISTFRQFQDSQPMFEPSSYLTSPPKHFESNAFEHSKVKNNADPLPSISTLHHSFDYQSRLNAFESLANQPIDGHFSTPPPAPPLKVQISSHKRHFEGSISTGSPTKKPKSISGSGLSSSKSRKRKPIVLSVRSPVKVKTPKPPPKTPMQRLLTDLYRNIQKRDVNGVFRNPVSDKFAPNYSLIIKRPMDLSTIRQNIADSKYQTLGDFKTDVEQMFDNAKTYNKPDTFYYKKAAELLSFTRKKLLSAESLSKYARQYPQLKPQCLSLNLSESFKATLLIKKDDQAYSQDQTKDKPKVDFPSFWNNTTVFRPEPDAKQGQGVTSSTTMTNFSNSNTKQLSFTGLIEGDSLGKKRDAASGSVATAFDYYCTPSILSSFHVETQKHTKKEEYCYSEEEEESDEEKFDGMSAKELIQSVQESARLARERLERAKQIQGKSSLPQLSYIHSCENASMFLVPVDKTQPKVPFKPEVVHNLQESDKFGNRMLLPKEPIIELNLKMPELKKVENTDEKNDNYDDDDDDEADTSELPQEWQNLLPIYASSVGLEYAQSIMRFAWGRKHPVSLVNTLLNVLTEGEHRKTQAKFEALIKGEFDRGEWVI